MKRLVARRALRYADRNYDAGEAFAAEDRDVPVLTLSGLAEAQPMPETPAPQVHEPAVSAMTAQPAEPAPRAKRRYTRRDMRAEK